MSLFDQAEADNRAILGDTASGFSRPVRFTDPDGFTAVVPAKWDDIHLSIDPETGTAVSGRKATVAVNLATLALAGLGPPKGIADSGKSPWLVEFDDRVGVTRTFKVTESFPDKGLGCVYLALEFYRRE